MKDTPISILEAQVKVYQDVKARVHPDHPEHTEVLHELDMKIKEFLAAIEQLKTVTVVISFSSNELTTNCKSACATACAGLPDCELKKAFSYAD